MGQMSVNRNLSILSVYLCKDHESARKTNNFTVVAFWYSLCHCCFRYSFFRDDDIVS